MSQWIIPSKVIAGRMEYLVRMLYVILVQHKVLLALTVFLAQNAPFDMPSVPLVPMPSLEYRFVYRRRFRQQKLTVLVYR
jgi:hypothetical protein